MEASREKVSPALKGFLINMIKETMYGAGYNVEQVLAHIAETETILDSIDPSEVTLDLLAAMSDDAFHAC